MKNTVLFLAAVALSGLALNVQAQCARGGGPGGGPHRYGAQQLPPPIAAVFDADANGVISETEMGQAPAQLKKLDQNKDGRLTADESCVGFGPGGKQCPCGGQGKGRGAGMKSQGQKPALIAMFDTDNDGVLSTTEMDNSPAVLLALDQNNDGQLTAEELRPMPGCRGANCPRVGQAVKK